MRGVALMLIGGVVAACGTPRAGTIVPPVGEDAEVDVRALAAVLACAPGEPTGSDVVAAHCRELRVAIDGWRSGWLATAAPVLASLRPANLPDVVVYPFGGGDLLTALATFPDAREITTLSLEVPGDPRPLLGLSRVRLYQALERWRYRVRRLLADGYNTTRSLEDASRGDAPGVISFALVALAAHGLEPTALRWFELEADGTPRYVAPPAAGVEIVFGDGRVYRHIAADLDDAHFAGSPVAAYLEARATVAAMTKAAGFLLWKPAFSQLRAYLLAHARFMISDATGVPISAARAAGFDVRALGAFLAPPFAADAPEAEAEARALWATPGLPALPFIYGYADSQGRGQILVITK